MVRIFWQTGKNLKNEKCYFKYNSVFGRSYHCSLRNWMDWLWGTLVTSIVMRILAGTASQATNMMAIFNYDLIMVHSRLKHHPKPFFSKLWVISKQECGYTLPENKPLTVLSRSFLVKGKHVYIWSLYLIIGQTQHCLIWLNIFSIMLIPSHLGLAFLLMKWKVT